MFEELLRGGQINEAMAKLREEVRAKPADAKLRVLLFQLLCVTGQWDRAMAQLNVAAELDAANLLMAQVCRPAIECEVLRSEVFAGKRQPLLLGQPADWVAWIVQANVARAAGDAAQSAALLAKAFDAAPATSGSIGDKKFQWIADADNRLGPLLEAVVNGGYYWVPFANIRRIEFDAPSDLRDVVWAPARFTWTNGGEAVGLIPTRYDHSESSTDSAIQLARRTEWTQLSGDLYRGIGQRVLATDEGEHPILETRLIVID
jgi:type VI secretion system protein ImpE